MRFQAPDQLSIILIWISAIFMAVKGGIESWPAANAAIPEVSAGWLSFIPLALLAYAAIRTLSVKREPAFAEPKPPRNVTLAQNTLDPIAPDKSDKQSLVPVGPTKEGPEFLPASISEEYLALLDSRPTEIHMRRFMRPFEGRWLELTATLVSLGKRGDHYMVHLNHAVDGKIGESIWANFDEAWEDHLHQIKNGDKLRFRGKVKVGDYGFPEFIDAIPL